MGGRTFKTNDVGCYSEGAFGRRQVDAIETRLWW